MVEGLSHITLMVGDLEKSKHMLEEIFSAKEIYSSDGKPFSVSDEKFFTINNLWIVLMKSNDSINKTYNHIAFKIRKEDYDCYLTKIKNLGLEIKDSRKRINGEGESIYFYDYDNHLFELHTGTLKERLKSYRSYLIFN